MGLVLKLTKLSNGQSSSETKIGIFTNLYTNHFVLRDRRQCYIWYLHFNWNTIKHFFVVKEQW